MPLYEFQCQACKHIHEKFCSWVDTPAEAKRPCTACGKRKVCLIISLPNVSVRMGDLRRKLPTAYRERKQQIAKANRGHKMKDNW